MPDPNTITKVEIWPVDVPITGPLVVATRRLVTAQNLFVRITLKSGAHGYGEIAPFPEVGGDDRPTCLQIATQLAAALLGQPAAQYRKSARLFHDMAAAHPAARCGLETALLDTLCRHNGDRKSTRLNSSHRTISYAVFCLKKKTRIILQ